MRITRPAKPALRMAWAARPPAWPAPMMTIVLTASLIAASLASEERVGGGDLHRRVDAAGSVDQHLAKNEAATGAENTALGHDVALADRAQEMRRLRHCRHRQEAAERGADADHHRRIGKRHQRLPAHHAARMAHISRVLHP